MELSFNEIRNFKKILPMELETKDILKICDYFGIEYTKNENIEYEIKYINYFRWQEADVFVNGFEFDILLKINLLFKTLVYKRIKEKQIYYRINTILYLSTVDEGKKYKINFLLPTIKETIKDRKNIYELNQLTKMILKITNT